MRNYDPTNWYWRSSQGRVFSSLEARVVPKDDARYQAWLDEAAPTPWPKDAEGHQSEAALDEVLASYGLAASAAGARALAVTQVNADAEVARQRYLTPGSGQALIYQMKAAELERFEADGDGEFPLLSTEIGVTAPTLADVARNVRKALDLWLSVGPAIERTRIMAKASIAETEQIPNILAIAKNIIWP